MALQRIMVTGAAGRIGQVVCEGLRGDYALRRLYHRKVLPNVAGEESMVGNITDLGFTLEACEGVDAVVHLAGNPSGRATFEQALDTNMRGTYHVYEAARQCGVRRVVFASTNHVTGFYEREGQRVSPEMPPRPDSFYGVSKALGETLGQYYADAFGLGVVCLRIGSFQPAESVRKRTSDRILSTWLSHRDAVQLVRRGIEASVTFGVYYGISGNTRAYWDIQNARDELGYAPEDDAEEYVG